MGNISETIVTQGTIMYYKIYKKLQSFKTKIQNIHTEEFVDLEYFVVNNIANEEDFIIENFYKDIETYGIARSGDFKLYNQETIDKNLQICDNIADRYSYTIYNICQELGIIKNFNGYGFAFLLAYSFNALQNQDKLLQNVVNYLKRLKNAVFTIRKYPEFKVFRFDLQYSDKTLTITRS